MFLHLPDPQTALTAARRVLITGGKIVILDVDFDSIVVTSATGDHRSAGRRLAS